MAIETGNRRIRVADELASRSVRDLDVAPGAGSPFMGTLETKAGLRMVEARRNGDETRGIVAHLTVDYELVAVRIPVAVARSARRFSQVVLTVGMASGACHGNMLAD